MFSDFKGKFIEVNKIIQITINASCCNHLLSALAFSYYFNLSS